MVVVAGEVVVVSRWDFETDQVDVRYCGSDRSDHVHEFRHWQSTAGSGSVHLGPLEPEYHSSEVQKLRIDGLVFDQNDYLASTNGRLGMMDFGIQTGLARDRRTDFADCWRNIDCWDGG